MSVNSRELLGTLQIARLHGLTGGLRGFQAVLRTGISSRQRRELSRCRSRPGRM
jgi:hypothetical protein